MLRGIVGVAGEDLVTALTVEHDFDAGVARQRHHVPLRVDAQRQRRLVEMPDDLLQLIYEIGWRDATFGGIRRELVDDAVRVLALVVVRTVVEVDREGLHTLDVVRRKSDDGARIQPAAQTHAEWHVAAQMDPHRLVERVPDGCPRRIGDAIEIRCYRCRAAGQVPVCLGMRRAGFEVHVGRGWEATDASEEGVFEAVDEARGSVCRDRAGVGPNRLSHLAQVGDDGLDLGREDHAVCRLV